MCPYTTGGGHRVVAERGTPKRPQGASPSSCLRGPSLHSRGAPPWLFAPAAAHPFPPPRPRCCACGWTSGTSPGGPRLTQPAPSSPQEKGESRRWEQATEEQGLTVAVVVTGRRRPSQTREDGADRGGPVRGGERRRVERGWVRAAMAGLHGERYRESFPQQGRNGEADQDSPSQRKSKVAGGTGCMCVYGGGNRHPPLPLGWGKTPKHLPQPG